MRKIILIGRSEAGKTTLTQALKGEKITYKKTQYINHYDVIIDTPGEYLQTGKLGRALLDYDVFEEFGIRILAGFDCNEAEFNIGKNKSVLPIKDIE